MLQLEDITMRDDNKTKAQLIAELLELRQQVEFLETKHSQAKIGLHESEQTRRSFIEKSSDGIVLINEQGLIIEWNHGQEEITGLKQSAVIGRPVWEVQCQMMPAAAKLEARCDQIETALREYFSTGSAPWLNMLQEINIRRADSTERIVQQLSFPIETPAGFMLGSIIRDVTEHKQATEALKISQEYARNIIDCSLDMIITVDMERRIVEFNQAAERVLGYHRAELIGQHVDILYADPQEAPLVHQLIVQDGQCAREILNRHKSGRVFPSYLSASVLRNARGEQVGVMGISRDITEIKAADETLRRRNRDLELLNGAGQTFISTLDLDQMLATVLDEVRRQLGVVACSAWLVSPESEELVCRQVTDPQGEVVQGWRLKPGQGLAGWVTQHGQSLNVPDITADPRHFKGVDAKTGLPLRAILTVPLQVKDMVIGVLQAVDAEVGRFSEADLKVLESLAATVAIAIENARLYEQAKQDVETKARLLREVNHRVKNNLAAIIGLLYAERYHVSVDDQVTYQAIIQDLIGRVQGLATVHSLLSASKWAPLPLREVINRVIHASLQSIPANKHVAVKVSPSDIQVKPKQANNLALVINELVTNTVKYALPDHGAGQLYVNITTQNEMVTLEFRDNGPGYPESVLRFEQHNVGMYLIQTLVRQDLRGELELRNENGAVTLIRFRAA